MTTLQPIKRQTLTSAVTESLRQRILSGEFADGQQLRQEALSNEYGVSRVPVREALRQLEAQSLLHVVAHKGAVVAPLVEGDAAETYALRILLECEALRLSIPLLDEEDFAEAARHIDCLDKETDYAEIGRLNRLFHMALYRKAPNRRLLSLIETGLWEEERFLRFNLGAMGLGKLTQDDHRELLRTAQARDIDLCVAKLTHHLNRAVEVITRYLNSLEPAGQKSVRS